MNYGVLGLSDFVHVIPSAYGSENYSCTYHFGGTAPLYCRAIKFY